LQNDSDILTPIVQSLFTAVVAAVDIHFNNPAPDTLQYSTGKFSEPIEFWDGKWSRGEHIKYDPRGGDRCLVILYNSGLIHISTLCYETDASLDDGAWRDHSNWIEEYGRQLPLADPDLVEKTITYTKEAYAVLSGTSLR